MAKKYLGVGQDQGATKILAVADPTLAQDAATKSYVDAADQAYFLLTPRATLGADVTAGTSATTTIVTLAVPANSVAVGDTFDMHAYGINNTTPTVTLSCAVGASSPGSTAVWTTPSLAPNSAAAGAAYLGALTVKSIGVSGTVMGGGMIIGTSSTAATITAGSGTTATQTVNTTAQWFITLRLLVGPGGNVVFKSAFIRKV